MTGTVNPPPGPFVERLPRGERIPADFEWVRPTSDQTDARTLADWIDLLLTTTAAVDPSALLAAIKTVDGAGSGLDADTLDGSSSAAFAAAVHTHDDRYYTESEITALLATKRELLSANRTYYVRTDGSDSNDGLTNSSGGAFLTIQKAIDTVYGLDFGIYNVTISVQSGTYTAGASFAGRHVGKGTLTLAGSGATISVTSANGIALTLGAMVSINGFTITTTTAGSAITVSGPSIATLGANMVFGAVGFSHLDVGNYGSIICAANYSITGSPGNRHIQMSAGSFTASNITVTLTGTPNFPNSFLYGQLGAVANLFSVTFSGSATGARYAISLNSVVQTYGAGASYLPGNSAGSATTGAQYV